MDSGDLAFTPALEQARLVRSRQVSPLELVELYLRRIEALDGSLGSFVAVSVVQIIAPAIAPGDTCLYPEQLAEIKVAN